MACSMVVFVMMHFGLALAMDDRFGKGIGTGEGSGIGSGSGTGSDSSSSDEEEVPEVPLRRMPHRASGSHSSALPPPPLIVKPPPFTCPACNRQFGTEFPCWQHMAGSSTCRERLPEDLQKRIRAWESEPTKSKRRKKTHTEAPWQQDRAVHRDVPAGPDVHAACTSSTSYSAASTSSTAIETPYIGAAPPSIPAPPIMAAGGFSASFQIPPPPTLLPGGLQALPVRPPPPICSPTATAGTNSAPPARHLTPTAGTSSSSATRHLTATAGTSSSSATRRQPKTPPAQPSARGPLVHSQAEVQLMIVGAVQAAIQGLLASRAMLSAPRSPRRRKPDDNNLD